ncbi:LacI family DNA-binding transcriptional regulator [Pontiellaceae bacterium B12219]|nr:LacI family DNA-binding transcriptional regulator [Pontiellaceae bacterium B12219]
MSNNRRVTLSDIAERTGVHKSTVSLALRGDPRIKEETRELIARVAEEMGHRPDTHLAHLMSYLRDAKSSEKNESVAYLRFESSDDANMDKIPFFREFRLGAKNEILRLGYSFDEFYLKDYEYNLRRLSDVLYNRGIRGLIVSPPAGLQEIKDFDWDKFSAITLGFRLNSPLLNRVVCDQIEIVRMVLEELIKLGYTRPLLAFPAGRDVHVENRWSTTFNGFVNHLEVLKKGTVHVGGADDAFMECLTKSMSDCVIGLNYSYAQFLLDQGFSIPEDLGFVLLDKDDGPEMITGIDQQPRYLGQLAARQLSGFIDRNEQGLPEHPFTLMTHPFWQGGTTTTPQNCTNC